MRSSLIRASWEAIVLWVRTVLLLLALVGIAHAQTNPGFLPNAYLCANTTDTQCANNTPRNPLGLNQAFGTKLDALGAGNVKAFGAVCDGVTDDTAAIQAAIMASQNNNGATVVFPAFCHITAPLSITGYVHLAGIGLDSGLKPSTTTTAISINTQASLLFENFSIQYPIAAASMTAAINVTAPAGQENVGSVFNNISIIFPQYGFYFVSASKWTVMNSTVSHPGQNAIAVQNTNAGDAGDSTILNNQLGTCGGACVYWASSGGLKIISNKINVAPTGIQIAMSAGVTTTGIYVTANSIEGITGEDILLQRVGTTGTLFNVVITGNELTGNYGLHVPTDATGPWVTDLSFVGNTFQGNPSATSYGVNVDSVTGLNVSSNIIYTSLGGTTTKIVTGSAATQGIVGMNACQASCSADSISSATISQVGYDRIIIPGQITGTAHIATAATPTVSAGQVGFGNTTASAGAGNCPSGTVGGKTVQGCLVFNAGGTVFNVPVF
jgi:hypothetical protein